jgi:oligopeptide transport system permease protein
VKHAFWREGWHRLKQNKPALSALIFLMILILSATVIPWFTTNTYYTTHLSLKNLPPSSEHWFGTDELGRDIFIRIWWGARISLFVGIAAACIDMVIGVVWGTVAAMRGGAIDEVMMRFADILYTLPNLLIVILLMVVMGPGLFTIIIALTLTGWITMARIVRSQVVSVKESDYVLAAKLLGASRTRIVRRYLIPNTIGSIITTMTLTIPTAIFSEAFLSFLGLGIQAPLASWGTMANDGLAALRYYPWRLFFPAAFISTTMLALNLLGDGLRDALDPRMRS